MTSTSPPIRRPRIILFGVTSGLFALVVIGLVWATRPSTWPPELDSHGRAALLAADRPATAEDLERLTQLVTAIAVKDSVVLGLLGDQKWPDPEISPAYWIQTGPESRSSLFGGTFLLELNQATYQGPWPSAGCRGGRYRGTVRSIDAVGLSDVLVVIDLNFERATSVSIPPTLAPSAGETPAAPVVRYDDDLADAPWYTGRCQLLNFRLR